MTDSRIFTWPAEKKIYGLYRASSSSSSSHSLDDELMQKMQNVMHPYQPGAMDELMRFLKRNFPIMKNSKEYRNKVFFKFLDKNVSETLQNALICDDTRIRKRDDENEDEFVKRVVDEMEEKFKVIYRGFTSILCCLTFCGIRDPELFQSMILSVVHFFSKLEFPQPEPTDNFEETLSKFSAAFVEHQMFRPDGSGFLNLRAKQTAFNDST
jgi:hypothetical protein